MPLWNLFIYSSTIALHIHFQSLKVDRLLGLYKAPFQLGISADQIDALVNTVNNIHFSTWTFFILFNVLPFRIGSGLENFKKTLHEQVILGLQGVKWTLWEIKSHTQEFVRGCRLWH